MHKGLSAGFTALVIGLIMSWTPRVWTHNLIQ
jgi:hypothetical protein